MTERTARLAPITMSPSLADTVAASVRAAILDGTFPPGHQLVERELGEMLGVSKTPVREALKTLATGGLVTIEPFKGAVVRRVDSARARGIYELRLLVEPFAVKRAAENVTADSERAARDALAEADVALRSSDLVAVELANRKFHRALYGGCDNEPIVELLDQLQEEVAVVAMALWRTHPTWEGDAREHEVILESFSAGQGHRAAELVSQHIARRVGWLDRGDTLP